MGESFAAVASVRIFSGLFSTLQSALVNVVVILIDTFLALYNAIAPKRPVNAVTPAGVPGAGGLWPTYIAPEEGDSRCSCPALNALANHGILPRSGKNITFKELGDRVQETYNFSPTFCFFVPNYIATALRRNYWKDSLDLADIDVHNAIEHDASLTREDSIFARDQGKPARKLIEELLMSGTGPNGDLTAADLSRLGGKRRAESRAKNPQYSLGFIHKFFSSANSSTLLTIFGGRVKDLRPFLLEERIPDGWESRIREPFGLTMAAFNPTVMGVELAIKEELPASFLADEKVGKQN